MSARALFVLTLLSCSLALADAKEDIEFAQQLAGRTYYDLAEEVCKEVTASPKASADEKASVPLVIANIKAIQAREESDPEKAKALIKEGETLLQAFLSSHEGHPKAEEARTLLGDLKMRLAQILSAAMQQETDAGKKAGYKNEISQLYVDVENGWRSRIKQLKDTLEKQDPQKDETIDALMQAMLELPRTLLAHARFGDVDDDARKKLLSEANTVLEDFNFNYSDRPMGYEGLRIQGECAGELGDLKKADDLLHGAIGLLDRLAENKIAPSEYHWQIVRDAYVALARLHMKNGNPQQAVSDLQEYLARHKDVAKTGPGYYVRILMGDALFQAGQRDRAISLAKLIMSDAGENSQYGIVAKDKIQYWLSAAAPGGQKIAAKDLFISGTSSAERGKFYDALQAFRQCIESASSEEKGTLVVQALFKMGECFQSLNRNYEAAAAFARVLDLLPKGEKVLGPQACFRAARCCSNEFNDWGAKADEDMKEKFLTRLRTDWPDAKESKNVAYLQAEKLERAGNLPGAADLYLKVPEDAEAYELALVSAGRCLYFDAAQTWGKSKRTDSDRSACKTEMTKAEDALKKFLARIEDSSKEPDSEQGKEIRAKVTFAGERQLALVYSHETVGKAQECLDLIDRIAKDLPATDERLASLWQLKIGAYLAKDELDKAVAVLEEMFSTFPDGQPIAMASKSVAIRLDQVTTDMMKDKKGDERVILENLRKLGKYYNKWIFEGVSVGLRISLQDVVSVAGTLYMIAKRLNGLDDSVVSFLDLKDRVIKERQPWKDAQLIHELLVGGRAGKLNDKDRLDLMTRLARCYSFVAENADDWSHAKDQYAGIVKAYNLEDKDHQLNTAALKARPALLGVYLELASVEVELGKAGQKIYFESAIQAYNNILHVTGPDYEPWWIARYKGLQALYARGQGTDAQAARVALENLQKSYPNFDNDKWGLKTQFEELERRLKSVVPDSH